MKFEEYARLKPEDWMSSYLRGVSFANAKRASATDIAALRSYNDAIAFVPADADRNWRARLFTCRAAVLMRLNRMEEAKADLSIAERHATDEYELNDVAYNLAALYALGEERDKLIEHVERISRDAPAIQEIKDRINSYFSKFKDNSGFLQSTWLALMYTVEV